MTVHVDIQCTDNRICVDWTGWSDTYLENIRQVSGRNFVKRPRKHWHVPLDMETCRTLRELYGRDLVIGPKLHSWAINAKRLEEQLGSLASSDTAELATLPSRLPSLYQAIHLGPKGRDMDTLQREDGMKEPASYQAADVAFLANAPAPLNANHQGTGKTIEWIASIWEAGIECGKHLIIAPTAAVDGTWEEELLMWQKDAPVEVGVWAVTGSKKQREKAIQDFLDSDAPIKWIAVNPAMIQYRKDPTHKLHLDLAKMGKDQLEEVAEEWDAEPTVESIQDALDKYREKLDSDHIERAKPKDWNKACGCSAHKDPHWHYDSAFPEIHDTVWNSICIDEAHKASVRNHRSITAKSHKDLKLAPGGKKCAMSGTPMRKMGSDIWGILNWLRPDVFTSYWRFAEDFFEIEDNGYGKKVGKLRKDRVEKFFRMLAPYVVRRTKAECLPHLPPKQYIDVRCKMTEKQAKQYRKMEEEGLVRLGETEISSTSVLSEFTRLRQFANAFCVMEGGEVMPTKESGKLNSMLEKMEEQGMFEYGSEEKQVVFSNSKRMILLAAEALREKGIEVDIISGGQGKKGQRKAIKDAFQHGSTRVLCIVTTAGGVSLTLDAADVAHFLDGSWSPDEMEQAEDRLHRASRVHQVRIYRYFSEDTVDDYIDATASEKDSAQKFILDKRRKLVK